MLRAFALVLCFLVSSTAFAQPRERFRLPEGFRQRDAHCYSVLEYSQLLQMDVDLEYYFNIHENLTERLLLRTTQVEEQQAQLTVLTGEVARLRDAWTLENRLRHEAENKPSVSAFVGWTLAIVGVVLAGAFGIAFAVSR